MCTSGAVSKACCLYIMLNQLDVLININISSLTMLDLKKHGVSLMSAWGLVVLLQFDG